LPGPFDSKCPGADPLDHRPPWLHCFHSGVLHRYMISFYGGKALVVRLERFLDVDWKRNRELGETVQSKAGGPEHLSLSSHSGLSISLVSIFAWAPPGSLRPFTLYTFLGSIFRCLLLGFFGWWIGATYEKSCNPFGFG